MIITAICQAALITNRTVLFNVILFMRMDTPATNGSRKKFQWGMFLG